MHSNADTTNKAGLICSQIYQVTRIQCELSGRRDSGTALAVVLVYTRSGYVSGHVVVGARGTPTQHSSTNTSVPAHELLNCGSNRPLAIRRFEL
jgi:hypothetical protein